MSTRGQGRGQNARGGSSGKGGGRGRGGGNKSGGGAKEEELKANLQKTIKDAEKLLKELNLEKGNKQQKDSGGKKKDTRGSQSMSNLNAGHSSKPKGPPPQSKGRDSPFKNPPQQNRGGSGRGRGRGGQVINRGCPQNSGPTPIFYPPPLISTAPSAPPPYFPNHPGNYGNMHPPQHHMPAPPGDPYPYMAPPPSYEESTGRRRSGSPAFTDTKSEKVKRQASPSVTQPSSAKLKPDALVKALAVFRGQFETAQTLGRHLSKEPQEVMDLAKSRKDLFAVLGKGNDAMIELVPKISLCSDYFTEEGCKSRTTCGNLHICKTYVTGYCNAGGVNVCQFGHRWDTNHNSPILSKFYLDLLDKKTLHEIVKKLSKDNFRIDICNHFNRPQGCKYSNACRRLHICRSYVEGGGNCSLKDCSLNHNIVDKQCINLLKDLGVAVNETPRDILLHVTSAISSLSRKDGDRPTGAESQSKNIKKVVVKEEGSSKNTSDVDSSDDTDDQDTKEKKKGKKRKDKKKVNQTRRSTDVHGDVEIPEICIYSIDNKCINEKKGCKYLHAKSLFHWQCGKDGKWYNLRIFQSKILETAYRDVAKGDARVPALDQNKLEDHAKELLTVLGTNAWKAKFAKMTMTDGDAELQIRRISTRSSASFNNPKATVFEWYFQDNQDKWIKYGQADSVGSQQFICNINGEDIEKQYLLDPSSPMFICNNEYKYKIDFSRMMQVNMQTDTEREVRRRPAGLSYQQKANTEENSDQSLPPNWTPMSAKQTHLVISLDSESPEYMEVSSRLRLTLPGAFIVSIRKLQNPYLWRLFQFKKEQLQQRYDDYQLNVQQLFHGVKPQDIDTICKENFDWRQVTTVQQDYGQGTYFSNSAAVGRTHCIPDEFGRSNMFLARVIIGTVTKGEPDYKRPPCNPNTCTPYDTTVDDVMAPTVFVKFEKDEYYPEYIIEFY